MRHGVAGRAARNRRLIAARRRIMDTAVLNTMKGWKITS
jgi:hypothetical protein